MADDIAGPKSGPKKFEVALARLESIIKELESEDIQLDKALKTFEEGVVLIKHAQDQLSKAEQKVALLANESDQENVGSTESPEARS